MTIAADDAQQGASHLYRAMRDFVQSVDDALPGKLEITKEGIVHDLTAPIGPRYANRKDFICSAWSTPARHPTPARRC